MELSLLFYGIENCLDEQSVRYVHVQALYMCFSFFPRPKRRCNAYHLLAVTCCILEEGLMYSLSEISTKLCILRIFLPLLII